MVRVAYLFKASGSVFKPVAITTLIVAVVFSGSFATVSAAKDSLPGDALYPVKLSVEKAQIGFALSEEKKANLEMSFASTRLDEVSEIIENKDVDSAAKIGTAIENFNKSLDAVEGRLERAETPKLSEIINEKTLILAENLKHIKEKITEEAIVPATEESVEQADSDVISSDGAVSAVPSAEEESLSETAAEDVPGQTVSDTPATEQAAMASAEETGDAVGSQKEAEAKSDQAAVEKASSLKKSIDHIDQALDRVDQTNTKSLVVIVKDAVKSPDNKKKEIALDKLQKKIESMETKIQNIETAATAITKEIEKEPAVATSTQDIIAPAVSSDVQQKGDAEGIVAATPPVETSVAPVLLKPDQSGQKTAATTTQSVLKSIGEDVKAKPVEAKKAIEEVKKIVESKETGKLEEVMQKVTETNKIVTDAKNAIKNAEAIIQAGNPEKQSSVQEDKESGKVLGEQATKVSEPEKKGILDANTQLDAQDDDKSANISKNISDSNLSASGYDDQSDLGNNSKLE